MQNRRQFSKGISVKKLSLIMTNILLASLTCTIKSTGVWTNATQIPEQPAGAVSLPQIVHFNHDTALTVWSQNDYPIEEKVLSSLLCILERL